MRSSDILASSVWLLALAAPVANARPYPYSAVFNLWQHLGNLSPYFTPDNTPEDLLTGVPPGCFVDKAFVLARHGSRHPISGELPVIQNLSYYINNNTALFSNPKASVPTQLSFLVSPGFTSTFILNNLTAPGRLEAFTHGVQLKLTYPQLSTNTFLVGNQGRVVETAQWYLDGYVGRYANYTSQLQLINEDAATLSWITPTNKCKNWTYSSGNDLVAAWGKVYLPPIATRINNLLKPAFPSVAFTADNMHGALWACAYGDAVNGTGSSPWCLPNNQGPVMGSLLVSNMTAFMTNASASAPNLFVNFGHDTTIDLGLTALGLVNDTTYPTTGPPNPARLWRTSRQVPFAAQMVFQRLSCMGGPATSLGTTQQRIQLLISGANFDLAAVGCATDAYGTCTFSEFLNTSNVRAAVGVTYGDDRWSAACGM